MAAGPRAPESRQAPDGRPTVGLMLPSVADPGRGPSGPERVIKAARLAEEGGFDGVYVGDHLLHPHPLLESVVALSAVAGVTERISLGPCVMLFALRAPLLLAKQLGTLAAFAPGRLRVGVGVGGEYPAEFEATGVPLAERGRRMESVLLAVKALMAEGWPGAGVTLQPVRPVPFLLAGSREAALRRAAALGDGWIGYLLGAESFSRRRDFLHERRQEAGAAGEGFTTGMLLPVRVDDSGRAAQAASTAWQGLTGAADLPERLFVAGSPAEVVDRLRRYWERGCTEMVLAPTDQGEGYLGQVDRLISDVLPQVRGFR